jgi:hypothetical protein
VVGKIGLKRYRPGGFSGYAWEEKDGLAPSLPVRMVEAWYPVSEGKRHVDART